jgi:hypothetical protein
MANLTNTTAQVQELLDLIEIGVGAKSSAIDAGYYGQRSLTDDYIYFCVQAGTAGNAIWKSIPLSIT